MNATTLAVAALAAGLCPVTSAYAFRAPSGQEVHQAKCARDPGGCYNEASQACQGSYQVIDSNSHAGGILADLLPGPVTWYG
jgi:hypothetical protein